MQAKEQLELFPYSLTFDSLQTRLWEGSFNGKESTVQQLSPYIGKMKSGMARALIEITSSPGDIVYDPFSGSGVVPLEAALMKRKAFGNDLSIYAYTLTKGKLEAPKSLNEALETLDLVLKKVDQKAPSLCIDEIPEWIKDFYNPSTLREILIAFNELNNIDSYFLKSCLLGILHHVRPGFLSYPASHLVPYLRKNKFPPDQFPEMYKYRDLRSRLIAKVRRAYKRTRFPDNWGNHKFKVFQENARGLSINDESIDCIVTSPPYFGALDYARDNRLRLWFLGCKDWKNLDASLTANSKVYIDQMTDCLKEMYRVLKTNSYCTLVLGDVNRNGKTKNTAEMLGHLAEEITNNGFRISSIYNDQIPDDRRSRRMTKTTKVERILILQRKF